MQIFASGRVHHDGVRRRQVVGGDVVRQHCQRAHAGKCARCRQCAFPIRRTADVGRHRAPIVQRADFSAGIRLHRKHRLVHLAELLRLDAGFDDGVDFLVARPDILQADFLAIDHRQHILLDIETDGAGNGVGHHQRRRSEEGLLGIRVDTAVEVAVARQYCGGVQIAVDDFLLDLRIQRARHAVARSTGISDDAKAKCFQITEQAGFFQIQRHCFRARCQRGFDPRLACQTQLVGVARQQRGGNYVARVAGVGATGDGGDDHRTVWHLPRYFRPLASDAFRCQIAGSNAGVRVGRASHIAYHARQIELEHAFVFGVFQAIRPQAGGLGVGFDQFHLLVSTAGEFQVIDSLLVNAEHRCRGAVFRGHIGNGGAVAQRQAAGAFAVEFQISADHFRFAQEFGQCQHHVGSGDAWLALAAQFDTDDIRQAHPRGAAEHDVFRFQAANTNRNHAQCVNVRRVAVSADAGVGISHTILYADHRRHAFQIDLVHDAVARRDHVDVLERQLGPVDEVETVFVAAIFNCTVLLECLWVEAATFNSQRVIDDQLHRHYRIDLGRIAALLGNRVTQASQIHQRGLAENVVTHHARRKPREIQVAFALDQLFQRIGQRGRITATHQVFCQHARGVRQLGPGAGLDRVDSFTCVEIIQCRAGQRFAVKSVHYWSTIEVFRLTLRLGESICSVSKRLNSPVSNCIAAYGSNRYITSGLSI